MQIFSSMFIILLHAGKKNLFREHVVRHSQQTGSNTLSFLIIGFHFSNLLDSAKIVISMSHKVFLDVVIASIPKLTVI